MKKYCFLLATIMCLSFATVSTAKNGNKFTVKKNNVENLSSLSTMASGSWCVCSGNGVRIRTAPSLKSKVVGYANNCDTFYCVGIVNGFAKIKYKGKYRYISMDYVFFPE